MNSPFGVSGGGNTLVGTVPVAAAGTFPTAPTVQFQSGTCANQSKVVSSIVVGSGGNLTSGTVTVPPTDVTRISGTKVAFKVPTKAYPELDADANPSQINTAGLVLDSGQSSAKWAVCLYDNDTASGTLLASTSYTLIQKPTITGVTPSASQASGGTPITVTGTGFMPFTTPNIPLTASIGGSPLTNIKVAANGASFTALTGSRGPGSGLYLTVYAPGGKVVSSDPDNNPATFESPFLFEYSNGITVTPNLASAGSATTLDITGGGFSDLTFDSNGSPTSANAHVFLVRGTYTPAGNRGMAECTNVVVVADTELICNLDLSAGSLNPVTGAATPNVPVPDGAYTVTVVANGATTAGPDAEPTIVSSGSTFTVGPY
ncbi:IPT/TIG domain-containing protein [Actinoplanes derwentensis]|uniref:IPT/TIG domain-containing protein n=1 Tax=Actinoplanes derwentensis TaxID=113562 RepID=UPI0012FE6BFE|nr:IPT/TIG domain-containing protein [Actinoplanes derwentensis]